MSFSYKWALKDGYPAPGIKRHHKSVFGTFVCGGGSTMGYKLAGYHHLGGVELDPSIAEIYKANHDPRYLFTEDIRAFNDRVDIPEELYNLDLLDGSPPCSSFSTAGAREKDWGKEKQFHEGQKLQRLDDLVHVYVETIRKLQPKVAILENVSGLIKGNAKSVARKIIEDFEDAGYVVQLFSLNAAAMGVPQRRQRVFFIGRRNDLDLPKLELNFNQPGIPFKEFDEGPDVERKPIVKSTMELWKAVSPGDSLQKGHPMGSFFNHYRVGLHQVLPTIHASAGGAFYHHKVAGRLTKNEMISAGSFPVDYDFFGKTPQYIIGMSVPPVMTANIAHEIYEQWLSLIDESGPAIVAGSEQILEEA